MEKSEKIELESKKARVAKGISGTILSIIMFGGLGVILIIVGLFLTITIIGAIIGIPMILAGLMFIIVSPFGGLAVFKQKKSKCPYCETVITLIGRQAFNCPSCQKRLIVKNGSLFLVE